MKKNKRLFKIVEQALEGSFKNDKVDQKAVDSVTKLFKKLPTSEAIYCLGEYIKGLKMRLAEHTLVVESATDVSNSDMKKITESMHSTYSILHTTFQKNPSLLGGLRIKIGDMVFDDSVENRIQELRKVIAS